MHGALTCLITDNRYAVPTLSFYVAADETQVRDLALADLRVNRHHEAVEVRKGDDVLFVLTGADLEAADRAA